MKKIDKKEDIIKEIAKLKDIQKNSKLTLGEEKNICKSISELEKSLPFAEPLAIIQERADLLFKE